MTFKCLTILITTWQVPYKLTCISLDKLFLKSPPHPAPPTNKPTHRKSKYPIMPVYTHVHCTVHLLQNTCNAKFLQPVQTHAFALTFLSWDGILERHLYSRFLGINSRLLRLEFLSCFLPTLFRSTKSYSWLDSSFLVSRIFLYGFFKPE